MSYNRQIIEWIEQTTKCIKVIVSIWHLNFVNRNERCKRTTEDIMHHALTTLGAMTEDPLGMNAEKASLYNGVLTGDLELF